MAKVKGTIVVDVERCKGCELCVTACPTQVIQMSKEVNAKGFNYSQAANWEACTGCANCAMVCPDMVITVYRYKPENA